ncbi:MAG: hypothetical protein E7141_00125 [Rikenellaceae bacterium]|nr:hypothetical protein [Rikenellaceae bacterium]
MAQREKNAPPKSSNTTTRRTILQPLVIYLFSKKQNHYSFGVSSGVSGVSGVSGASGVSGSAGFSGATTLHL